jgi:glutamine amidotransferase
MEKLKELNLIEVLSKKVIQQETPILGICLGMQLLSKKSEEGNVTGLGWIDAETNRFSIENNQKYKIPHMGWNNVYTTNKSPIMHGISESDELYFVHSYHLECEAEDIIIGETDYCYRFVSAIQKDNIYGTQFHPEKSHDSGLKILKNFLETV